MVVLFFLHSREIIMFPSDQFSAADKEYLYDRLVLKPRHCNNITVFGVLTRNLLPLGHLFHTMDQIPVSGRLFKIHFGGSRHHFLFQIL